MKTDAPSGDSPFEGIAVADWSEKTRELIEAHPLTTAEIVEIALGAWNDIFESSIGPGFRIGKQIFPQPQIMSFLLHELIPLEAQRRHPKEWRPQEAAHEKDLVHVPNDHFSVEVKASSHPRSIFGNRSYAQKGAKARKLKSGYFLAINFGKFKGDDDQPPITRIRFGWLDHEDWIGQTAPTGQQAHLSRESDAFKLVDLLEVAGEKR